MRQRIEHARRQAAEARGNALRSADQRFKDEWLRVSHMWEELAHEYGEVTRLLDQVAARST